MLIPHYLKKGDTVLLIATARSRSLDAIEPAIRKLEEWGLKVELGRHALKTHHQFAGTDDERAEDLQWALDHLSAKAILLTGGGYGTMRIIDRISIENFRKHPKWVAGYSDATFLHARLLKEKIASIHSTMAFQFTDHEATESLRRCFFGEEIMYTWPPNKLNCFGTVEAETTGGNLSLLYALSGSSDEVDTAGKLLFLEDIDEQLYHLDRMIRQLSRSNKLGKIKGLLVGGLTEMKDNLVPFGQAAEDIVAEMVANKSYPVAFGFSAGHIKRNLAFYLGRKARLTVDASGSKLEFI